MLLHVGFVPFVVYLTVPSLLVVLQLTLALLPLKHALVGLHVGAAGAVLSITNTHVVFAAAFVNHALSLTVHANIHK